MAFYSIGLTTKKEAASTSSVDFASFELKHF